MNEANLSPALLLEVIKTQTEIARLGVDLGSVMQLVCQRASGLIAAGGAVVELAEGEEMVYRAAAGFAESTLGLRLKRNGSLSGLCVAQDHILRCDDSELDDRVDRAACRKVGLRSMLVVPLRHDEETVGVLKVMSAKVSAFGEQDEQLLGLLSDLIGAAIHHAVKFASDDLYYRATHDALTTLANRALFFDRLRQQLAHSSRKHCKVGILNIDMDGLKAINDNLGHRAGDAAICEVASRISAELRADDLAARMGGDEFGVILSGVRDRVSVEQKCALMAERIRTPFEFEGRPLCLGASIGLAISPEDGTQMEQLIEIADQAMYSVKHARRGAAAGVPVALA
ncbi:diguanylate cyclase domain-containing protein [Pseudoduganella sp. UC29_106]|uniref:diguanylate cyclase domain-containing protein n=1 Tax=Pseudoduganella sp. UC29_106 TaxID=3374553 RepID=UPI00375672BB